MRLPLPRRPALATGACVLLVAVRLNQLRFGVDCVAPEHQVAIDRSKFRDEGIMPLILLVLGCGRKYA